MHGSKVRAFFFAPFPGYNIGIVSADIPHSAVIHYDLTVHYMVTCMWSVYVKETCTMDMNRKAQGLYSSAYEHDACGVGFVANIKGKKSHDIVERGLQVLVNMTHRGAEGADNKTGDGAGIMIQMPHTFIAGKFKGLPNLGGYASGLVFLPQDTKEAEQCVRILETNVVECGQQVFGWRDVPTDDAHIGRIAKEAEPVIRQVVIKAAKGLDQDAFERKLYVIRKYTERLVRESGLSQSKLFYIPTLSSKVFLYKGMLQPDQVQPYFPDLRDADMTSAIALVHSRFSTNTFPSWDLAQPFRMIAHNGEINTVKGNRAWMSARESLLASELFGDDIKKLLPVIEPDKSDSASFDNVLELLVMAGRSLPHALMMMVPESWNDKNPIAEPLKKVYEYHAMSMEPWDGPASMVFCDGRYVGGTLDRNGLRPSRYVITKDDMIVMGSEVGVQVFKPEQIAQKGRLRPGKLLLVDTEAGRIISDGEIKDQICEQRPYAKWVDENRLDLSELKVEKTPPVALPAEKLLEQQLVFGYNREDVGTILNAMITTGQEATGSMGTDTPLAVLSQKPQRLFNYFKQIFAQVTNPPIDPIREELVMTLTSFIGAQQNLLSEGPEHCRSLKYLHPVFTNTDMEKIRNIKAPGFKSITLPMFFSKAEGDAGLEKALKELCAAAEKQVDAGHQIIILSDKGADEKNVPIPSLLACGAVHHHLLRTKKRTQMGLIIETGEAREVMHFVLLFGYGANAINPYLALATIHDQFEKKMYPSSVASYEKAELTYTKGLDKAILKVISKMGTSTLRSYRAAQVFEAVGLGREVIDMCFAGTASRIHGLGLKEIAKETVLSHEQAFTAKPSQLPSDGVYQYRKGGEKHAWNPDTIMLLQHATRSGSYEKFKEFSKLVNAQNQDPHVLRGYFDFKPAAPISIDEVEPVSEIVKRFCTGAMSFGSISKEAHEALAMALNKLGGRSNTGEGGEDPERFKPRADGWSARSSIKQIASGRFGVTTNYLVNADELQIKMAQGAKPGEGGQLPGHKVDTIIGQTRHSTPGVTLISPPPHHDIYSIEDLAQLIFDLKNVNPSSRVSVKLVSEVGVGTIAAGVAKAHADMILISGYDGGTGASPISSIKHAGLPWELGLAEAQQTLVMNELRDRVRIQTDGQLKTGRDVVIAAMLGAEEYGFSTSALITLGCIMMRKCHVNTCPVGIATQDPELRRRFSGKPEYVINFLSFIAQEVREILASLGVKKLQDIVGRADMLQMRTENMSWKAKTLSVADLLHIPAEAAKTAISCVKAQDHKIDKILDHQLIEKAKPALEKKEKVSFELPIINVDRTVGAMFSGEIIKRHGEAALPEGTVNVTFNGSAGQSFGAFLVKGVEFRLQGDSNDYLGKGLSGGRIIVVPPKGSTFKAEENIIIGNTVLYGATSGEVFVRGVAGERFCVRNSGATAVIEGVGDHCCEYMTGGTTVVLGRTGRNFAAGMSGGVAYVLNVAGNFEYFCNKGMVELTPVNAHEDQVQLKSLIEKHLELTGSTLAKHILKYWTAQLPKFVKVMPVEYKKVLEQRKLEELHKKMASIVEAEQLGEHSDG